MSKKSASPDPSPDPVSAWELIERETESGQDHELYQLMDRLISARRDFLAEAKIGLVWRRGWRPKAGGWVTLGRCAKVNDLGRVLHGYDFVIVLNFDVWDHADFSAKQKEALLYHELCHADVTRDKHGEIKRKDGRPCWRVARHDVEEFLAVVSKYGAWQQEIQQLATATLEAVDQPLLAAARPASPNKRGAGGGSRLHPPGSKRKAV
jgi:hypothetical protein